MYRFCLIFSIIICFVSLTFANEFENEQKYASFHEDDSEIYKKSRSLAVKMADRNRFNGDVARQFEDLDLGGTELLLIGFAVLILLPLPIVLLGGGALVLSLLTRRNAASGSTGLSGLSGINLGTSVASAGGGAISLQSLLASGQLQANIQDGLEQSFQNDQGQFTFSDDELGGETENLPQIIEVDSLDEDPNNEIMLSEQTVSDSDPMPKPASNPNPRPTPRPKSKPIVFKVNKATPPPLPPNPSVVDKAVAQVPTFFISPARNRPGKTNRLDHGKILEVRRRPFWTIG